MTPINQDEIFSRLTGKILGQDRFVITTHRNPDPDGVGAELGMLHFLQSHGKEAIILNADPLADRLHFLDPENQIGHAKEDGSFSLPFRDPFLLSLDNSDLDRTGPLQQLVHPDRKNCLILDHHDHIPPDLETIFEFPEKSSTSEIVYEILERENLTLPPTVARGLYVGLVADTGNFRFRKTTPRTHEIAARLMATGIRPEEITEKLQFQAPLERLLLRKILYESLKIDESGRVALLFIRQSTLAELGLTYDHLENFGNELIEPAGIQAGILLSERGPGKTKVSLRSKGSVNLLPIVEKSGGGGHRNACGVTLSQDLDEVAESLIPEVVRYLTETYPDRE